LGNRVGGFSVDAEESVIKTQNVDEVAIQGSSTSLSFHFG
jgi:hypothetical protein